MLKIKSANFFLSALLFAAAVFFPSLAWASLETAYDYTGHWAGYFSLGLFILAYALVIVEESTNLRKSKPVILAAAIIWLCVAYVYKQDGRAGEAAELLRHNFLEYAELAFFLLSAMTYINTLAERNLFQAWRVKLVAMGFSYRALFWITGIMAFFLSPLADNMTTALVLGAVVMAAGEGNPNFIAISCINIVVAANAGGAFSPFGDITTLMVWQKGMVTFFEFFKLFIPALLSWLVPAFLMSLAIKNNTLPVISNHGIKIKKGGIVIALMFLFTIAMTVTVHNTFDLPPFFAMMTGLGLLMCYSYFIRLVELKMLNSSHELAADWNMHALKPFDIFISIRRAEWDTLIFFYGIILCVGGLAALGYLSGLSHYIYGHLGATGANILVGFLSALIDNIPVIFAVLTMDPEMTSGQWLLVTLTAGIGGSLLSIGSAAGVALMGQAKGVYTFSSHLKWFWAIALGYGAGIGSHILINTLN